MDKMKETKIDVVNMTEAAMNGVCHLFTRQTWENLLKDRICECFDAKTLTADFIVEHKNDIKLNLLTAFGLAMTNFPEVAKGYNLDFFHRFWKVAYFDGGKSAHVKFILDDSKYKGSFVKDILEKQDQTMYEELLLEDVKVAVKKLPTWSDYEKNPYYYDAIQLLAMVQIRPDIPMEFIERFIHLVNFAGIMVNINNSLELKQKVAERFGVQVGNTGKYVFPDGSSASGEQLDDVQEGLSYYDNVLRYNTEDEKTIRELIKKFPRAVEDCFHPDNALAMQGK